ncbi:MAG: nitrile hydratase accessory protein [Actinomycetota bacterium]|nr:nitrile hydratase accessory protein [Actinomycetota bacterium]
MNGDPAATAPGVDLAMEGPAAPPRLNGELVFDAPWQTRAFGMAAALVEAGQVEWTHFQAALITRVRLADSSAMDTGVPSVYWQCWLDSLGDLATDGRLIDASAWSDRSERLAGRPSGHDH